MYLLTLLLAGNINAYPMYLCFLYECKITSLHLIDIKMNIKYMTY